MLQQCARALLTTRYVIVVLCLVSSFKADTAHSDSIYVQRETPLHLSVINKDIQCKGLPAGNSICNFKTEIQYDRYTDRPSASHEDFFGNASDIHPEQTDLITVFKFALEEYDLFPGVRIHWESTARKFERWALKLKLKGEIPVSGQYNSNDASPRKSGKSPDRVLASRPQGSPSIRSLLAPQKIKWNLRMDPENMNVSGDLHVNSYLSFSTRVGNDSQVGLNFRYAF